MDAYRKRSLSPNQSFIILFFSIFDNSPFSKGKVEEGKNLVAVEKKTVSIQDTPEIDPNHVFQNLISTEATLTKEKKKTVALKKKPLSKLNKKIESKKKNKQNPRTEIKNLKLAWDEPSKSLQLAKNSNSPIEAETI